MANKYTKSRRGSKTRNRIYDILIFLFAAVFFFSVYKISSYYLQNFMSKSTAERTAESVVTFESNDTAEVTADNEDGKRQSFKIYDPPLSIDFNALKAQNADVEGWLFSPNGIINYPVLKSDTDDEYYLDHLINGQKNINGSLFITSKFSDGFSDANTVIHGHSMKNGSMFGMLLHYKYQYYYDIYPSFYLYTPEKNYRLDIVSVFETVANDKIYNKAFTQDKTAFCEYVNSKTCIRTQNKAGETDSFITLSTCDYDFDDARCVVVLKKVETK